MQPRAITPIADDTAHFPGPRLAYVTASMRAGNTAARLWELPQDDGPPLLLLWDQGNNVFYWAGPPDGAPSAAWVERAAGWVNTALRDQALALDAPYFRTAACTPALAPLLPALFAGIELHPYPVYLYAASGPPRPAAPPPGITLTPITPALLARADLANVDEVAAEIRWMWPTLEHYAAAGFGVAACTETAIVCWCTAEYVSATACGVGITTAPAYRRAGIATAAATRLLGEARRRGLTAYWECGQNNVASTRLAETLGLTRLAAEQSGVGSFAA